MSKYYILGISAFYHDSAAALICDGEIIAAVQEERFTRKKHDDSFPYHSIEYIIDEAAISIDDIDLVIFYDKPFLKFERILDTFHSFAPRGLKNFLLVIPNWLKNKIFIKNNIRKELARLGGTKRVKLLFSEHHLSHAASAFFPSGFKDAAIVVIDGVGEWATTTIAHGENNSIRIIKEMRFPHSLGLLYSAFTYYCGFRVNSGEYKLMGLAPYGDSLSPETQRIKKLILDELIDLKPDGSFILNLKYFNFHVGLTMCHDDNFFKLFNIPKRNITGELTSSYMNMALAIQEVTEEIVLRIAKTAQIETKSKKLVLAGGVALNCVANGKLVESKMFDDIWIQPAAGDAGGALGAAYVAWYMYKNSIRNTSLRTDSMQGSLLGPKFCDETVEDMANKYCATYEKITDFSILCNTVSSFIAEGKVVGWFQGRMEFGPRALGNRSILADARSGKMQKKVNLNIKFREGFRPFAPSVLEEVQGDFFEMKRSSPYMLLVSKLLEHRRFIQPENYNEMSLYEKLYYKRSEIPAVTHLDYSARIQTVIKKHNPKYWQLLNTFKQQTGVGILLNTSFNVRGEPIVCSPDDAFRCFMQTKLDALVINNYIFYKDKQTKCLHHKIVKQQFAAD